MNQGSSQQNSDDGDIKPKKFMDSDNSEKAAILNEMSTVVDMEKILPEDLKTWDKETTSLVLEKAFSLCGLSRTTEGRSTEDVKTEQDSLKLQLDALKKKKAKNAALLEKHRQVAQARYTSEGWLQVQRLILELRDPRDAGFNLEHEQITARIRAAIAQQEAELEGLESPLRD